MAQKSKVASNKATKFDKRERIKEDLRYQESETP
jgi:hypothetical protein